MIKKKEYNAADEKNFNKSEKLRNKKFDASENNSKENKSSLSEYKNKMLEYKKQIDESNKMKNKKDVDEDVLKNPIEETKEIKKDNNLLNPNEQVNNKEIVIDPASSIGQISLEDKNKKIEDKNDSQKNIKKDDQSLKLPSENQKINENEIIAGNITNGLEKKKSLNKSLSKSNGGDSNLDDDSFLNDDDEINPSNKSENNQIEAANKEKENKPKRKKYRKNYYKKKKNKDSGESTKVLYKVVYSNYDMKEKDDKEMYTYEEKKSKGVVDGVEVEIVKIKRKKKNNERRILL